MTKVILQSSSHPIIQSSHIIPMKTLSQNHRYSIELAIGLSVERLPVIIRKMARSRRMVIRYQPLQHHVTLTLPRYVSIKQGLHFLEEKRGWLEREIKRNAKPI